MYAGRYSIAKLVQFSEEIKRIFVEYAEQRTCCFGALLAISVLQRIVYSKPLGRTCLFALELTLTRTDSSSQKAKQWLEWLLEERDLLAAMLAPGRRGSCLLKNKQPSARSAWLFRPGSFCNN